MYIWTLAIFFVDISVPIFIRISIIDIQRPGNSTRRNSYLRSMCARKGMRRQLSAVALFTVTTDMRSAGKR